MLTNFLSEINAKGISKASHFDVEFTIIHALDPTYVKCIFVYRKIAYPAMGLKYIQDLDKWTAIILRERNNGEKITPC